MNHSSLENYCYKVRKELVSNKIKWLKVADDGQLHLGLLPQMTKSTERFDGITAGGHFHSRTALSNCSTLQMRLAVGECITYTDSADHEEESLPVLNTFSLYSDGRR